jgi:hypothetical protein
VERPCVSARRSNDECPVQAPRGQGFDTGLSRRQKKNCHPEAADSAACDRIPTKDLCTFPQPAVPWNTKLPCRGGHSRPPPLTLLLTVWRGRPRPRKVLTWGDASFQRCDITSRRIYGMAENHPRTRCRSRPSSFRTAHPPTAAIPLHKTSSFRICFSDEESAFPGTRVPISHRFARSGIPENG